MATFVDELATVREALGLDRVHLFGHSWGGHAGPGVRPRPPRRHRPGEPHPRGGMRQRAAVRVRSAAS
ncbi:hypothetical protein [Streptomyces sp.]|uniref:hypothetical protein n=1 Tax=Streptomyces sp. TaxID=1931 RepID=UPI0039C8D867